MIGLELHVDDRAKRCDQRVASTTMYSRPKSTPAFGIRCPCADSSCHNERPWSPITVLFDQATFWLPRSLDLCHNQVGHFRRISQMASSLDSWRTNNGLTEHRAIANRIVRRRSHDQPYSKWTTVDVEINPTAKPVMSRLDPERLSVSLGPRRPTRPCGSQLQEACPRHTQELTLEAL